MIGDLAGGFFLLISATSFKPSLLTSMSSMPKNPLRKPSLMFPLPNSGYDFRQFSKWFLE
jgi:hypothetical protein